MAFHEDQFPSDISKGSAGGPERLTDIVTLRSGHEERNTIWTHSRRRYDASLGVRDIDDMHEVIEFFEARRGRLHGFRWKDWADWKSCPPKQTPTNMDQVIGVGDGTEHDFQLQKVYSSGGSSYTRPIKKPVAGTVLISKNGVSSLSGWTVDTTTGIIHFTSAPTAGHIIRAGFEFDVPVRFDQDMLSISVDAFQAGSIGSIDIIEVRV